MHFWENKMTHLIELEDEELFAIPQDKRAKIIQAQIEGGRTEIADLYESLTKEHDSVAELEYSIKELTAYVNEERRKVQANTKQRDKTKQDLLKRRSEVSELETKLRSYGGDHRGDTIHNSEIDKLTQALEKEEANVLKYRALIEKRNNEIKTVDLQFQGDMEQLEIDEKNVSNERAKLIDLIELNMQRLSLMKQRNEECLKSVASHTLDAQLTATLESFAQD